MSNVTDIVSAVGNAVSALAACVAAIGVWYARHQLKTSREIAQLQFEDSLGKEIPRIGRRAAEEGFNGRDPN